jgi:CheY-like chemotaxis protein
VSELDRPELAGKSVLVVDDDADSREMLAAVLERSGAVVSMAESAPEAFAAFQRERPHVVLLDLGLPDEDGFSLIKRLRELSGRDGANVVPAIALTGYGSPEDRDQTRSAGFQAHLVKPIGLSDMLDCVVKLLRSRSGPSHL